MQKKEKKRDKLVLLKRSFFLIVMVSIIAWNVSLMDEAMRSKKERNEIKLNIEKVEILEKVNRNFIKDTLRRKAIALCFWELIEDYQEKFSSKEKEDCIQLIVMADEKFGNVGMDAALILAWIDKESSGNPEAVSLYGAKGLTQWIDYRAWKILVDMGYPGYDQKLVLDPVINLAGGLYYLENLLKFWEWKSISDKFPVLFYALHSYLWGAENSEVLLQKEEKGNGQDVQDVNWILNNKAKWAEKLNYWIEDGEKMEKDL